MTDEFDFEFHDEDFEKMVKINASSWRAKELINMSRKVDRFGNKMHDDGCRIMIGVVTQDDYFKFYSDINPLNSATPEMLARLILKTCEEIKIAQKLDESPLKEVLKWISEEAEARG